MAKLRTTINIEEGLIEEIRRSGVANVSRYLENLAKKDLRGVEKTGKGEKKRVQKMVEELDKVEDKWHAYLKTRGEA